MGIPSRFVVPGIVFLLTLATGFWLSRGGRPYSPVFFNIHKLIALGAVILIGVQTYRGLAGGAEALLPGILVTVAAAAVVALFATGAFMSMGVPAHRTLLMIHSAAPAVLLIAVAGVFYLLVRPSY